MMSTLASIQPHLDGGTPRLGPAEVEVVEASAVHVRLSDQRLVRAELALAFSYEPAVGDTMLVIGDEAGHYVIGVMRGRGQTRLTFPGDVELRSTDGVVRVAGATGVDIQGPTVSIRAERLTTLVETARHVATELFQTIHDIWHSRAGNIHSIADNGHHIQAEHATIATKQDVSINGKTVHLG